MTVVMKGDQIGVEAHASFHPPMILPGGKPYEGQEVTDFIPAE
jgi:hypothetical protein